MTMRITSNKWIGESSKFTIDNQGKEIRTYQHKRLVKSQDNGSNRDLAKALGYYAGQAFTSDPPAKLRDMDIDRRMTLADGTTTGPQNAWDLTLNYSTEATSAFNQTEEPTRARVERSWGTTSQTVYIVKDRNGAVIVNTANQPFDGGIPISIELPTLTYVRNEYGFSGALAAQYSNALNSDTYSGCAPGTLRCKIRAQKEFQGDYEFDKVTYEMAYYAQGWQPQPLNAGLWKINSGRLIPCLDDHGVPVTSPVPLTLSGDQVPTASLPSGANFRTVLAYNTLPFGGLTLPPY